MSLELEVIVAPDGCERLPRRMPLPASFGRGEDNDRVVALDVAGRRHCRFDVEGGRPVLHDLGSTHGTFVNGARSDGRKALAPGDFVEIPWGLVLRVVDASTPPVMTLERQHEFVRLVTEAPHDETRWRVWADRLLEAGDALGERIARGRGATTGDDAKALGPLARDFLAGGLEVEWRHGFIRRAVLRNYSPWPPATWLLEWKLLIDHPLATFVEELEVDALSYSRGIEREGRDGVEGKIVSSLLALAKRAPLPLLHSVRCGPSPRQLWSRDLDGAWKKACAAHPALRAGPIWVSREAWLQLLSTPNGVAVSGLDVGAQRKLGEDQANLVGPLPDCSFALEAPDGSPSSAVALRLDLDNGLWVAEDMGADARRLDLPLIVNGRKMVGRCRLRPGDVLEPAPGLTFRFVME